MAQGDVTPIGGSPDVVGKDIEKKLLSGEISYSELNAGQRYAYGGVRQANQRQAFGPTVGANAPGVYTPGLTYDAKARADVEKKFMEQLNAGSGFKLPKWMKPVEQVASGLYWVYSKFISQPVSFLAIEGRQLGQAAFGNDSDLDPQNAWQAARYTSPGQAIYMAGMNNGALRANGIEPTDLAATRESVDQYFKKGPQKWVSGISDLAVSWYVDPFVLVGKTVGASRGARYVKPTKNIDFSKFDTSKTVAAISKNVQIASKGATPEQATARLMRDVPLFAKNRTNGTGQVLAELMVRTGGDSTQIARLIESVNNPATLTALRTDDQLMKSSLRQITNKTAAIGTEKSGLEVFGPLTKEASERMSVLDTRLSQLADETALIMDRYADNMKLRSIYGTVDNLYTRNVIGPAAQKLRQTVKESNPRLRFTEPTLRDPLSSSYMPRRPMTGPLSKLPTGGDLLYNGTIYPIIKLYRGFQDVKPNYYLKLDDPESFRHVDAILRDVKTVSPEMRNEFVGKYMAAPVKDRPIILQNIEHAVVKSQAAKAGISEETATQLYRDFFSRRGAVSSGNIYTTAQRADGTDVNFVRMDSTGTREVVAPLLKSNLAENWVMTDFNRMGKLLDRSGPALERLLREDPTLLDKVARGRIVKGENAREISEALNSLWKFSQLARPGYMPRAIGDELLGQLAALGPMMMTARVLEGGKNVGMKTLDRVFTGGYMHNAREADRLMVNALEGNAQTLSTTISKNEERLARINDRMMNAKTPAKRRALRRDYDNLLHENNNLIEDLTSVRNSKGEAVNHLATSGTRNINISGRTFEGAFEGTPGAMFKSMISASTTINNLMGRSSSNMLHYSRSVNWAPITASMDEGKHLEAWLRDLTHQIRNDEFAMLRVNGATPEQMERWLVSTPEGRAYRQGVARQTQLPSEFAEDVAAHVDHYLPEEMLGREEIIRLLNEEKLTGKELKESMKASQRPSVHSEQLGYAMGNMNTPGGRLGASMDNAMSTFYKWMNEMPAQHLSRNPLFAQLYRSHLKDGVKAWDKRAGATHLRPDEYAALEGAARKLALRDTKALVFNMDYEARVAYSLRFMAPFFGAQLEAWTRWSRIVADKPQILARAAQAYGAPARAGWVTTYNGDQVDGYGNATNSETGETYKVDKSDQFVNIPIPEDMKVEISRALGVDVTDMQIPLNSLNLVLQNEPAFSPGFGPVVQIPVNEYLTGGKLGPMEYEGQYQYGDLVQELGILPFGPTAKSSDMITPVWMQRFLKSDDESSKEYISNFTTIMNMEMWNYENGGRETKPTAKEIQDKARKFTFFSALAAYASPFKPDFKNPLQFYMDAYKKVQATGIDDPQKAFLDKYGESMWMFTTALTKTNSGMPSTTGSVKLQKRYQDLIDTLDDPSLARLIEGGMTGDEFSKTAYVYQLTNEIQTGSGVMGREKLSPKEAMDRQEADRGWYMFNKAMTGLQAKLFERGLESFEDSGAADLKAMRKGYIDSLSRPEISGRPNKYYNEAWSRQYLTVDPLRMERKIADMRKIVNEPTLQGLANGGLRSDLGSLKAYIDQRDTFTRALAIRKEKLGGSADIKAKSNEDIRRTMATFTDTLIQNDTRFGELHNRYLQSDMGYNLIAHEEE
jgi:hypothetical protein